MVCASTGAVLGLIWVEELVIVGLWVLVPDVDGMLCDDDGVNAS